MGWGGVGSCMRGQEPMQIACMAGSPSCKPRLCDPKECTDRKAGAAQGGRTFAAPLHPGQRSGSGLLQVRLAAGRSAATRPFQVPRL